MTINPSLQKIDHIRKSLGRWGEDLVVKWLEQEGWEILQRRWSCRYGELDIIAISANSGGVEPTVIFVEVKTRSDGNWDGDGKLTINRAKQAKIIKSAQVFLSERPDLANYPCRFDVALVKSTKLRQFQEPLAPLSQLQNNIITPEQPIMVGNYNLTLQDYISSAFIEID